MTSLSENDQKNEINIDSTQCSVENDHLSLEINDSKLLTAVIQESSDIDQKQQELNEKRQSNQSISALEQNNIINGINNSEALINTSLPIVTTDEEQKQQPKEATETTVNHDEHEHTSRKSYYSKPRYSSMSYHRSPYYMNCHSYESPPPSYYYYQPLPPSLIEKPTPLMFVSTLPSPSSSSSSRDNQSGNSAAISPQNLPPRLRQTSTAENESNLQVPSTTSTTSQSTSTLSSTSTTTTATTTNGRRHRSILPRGNSHYHPSHLPPPLMATPPGVLYTYPPAVHHPGHIAYNIRPPDEFEILAFQQQMMNIAPNPLLWSHLQTPMSSYGHPYFPAYAMDGSLSGYMLNNTE
ncbi:unnamed protein product, partial [Rotaria magnacalcarata]